MSVGKLAAQAGHAYLDAFLAAPPDLTERYRTDGHGTKVCLAARSLDELLLAKELASLHDVPHALVVNRIGSDLPRIGGESAIGCGMPPRLDLTVR
jgi:peptidyl-tRNA hydrolase